MAAAHAREETDSMNDAITSEQWIERLRALQGDYRPPRLNLLLVQLLATVLIGMGAYILFRALHAYQYTQALPHLIYGAAFGGTAVVVGFYQQRRAACGYRFVGGQIRFISGVGRVLWLEDLRTLERVEHGPTRRAGPDYLLLHWARRTRRVDLLGGLKAALLG
jgi:hypothetical protein